LADQQQMKTDDFWLTSWLEVPKSLAPKAWHRAQEVWFYMPNVIEDYVILW